MRDRSWAGAENKETPSWLRAEMDDVFAGAAILLVEDDADIRELLVTLFRFAGFAPTACGTAEQALQQLRDQAFDLVLTDYALPNHTGGWLLRQASEEGLLGTTPALVVTAHPSPADINGFEIIQKPFDLDQLVDRVCRRLESGPSVRPRTRRTRARRQAGRRAGLTEDSHRRL